MMTRHMIFAAATAAAALAAAAHGGTLRHDVSAARPAAVADYFDTVGRFVGHGGDGGFLASGTLVADDWVLTAGHVAYGADALSFDIGGQTYQAGGWVVHGEYDPANPFAGRDLALVQLDRPVANVVPAPLTVGNGRVGDLAVSVGYGRTGDGLTGHVADAPGKLGGTNVMDLLHRDLIYTDFDDPEWWAFWNNATGGDQASVYELAAAPGDSGGGLFTYDAAADLFRLTGVTSFGYGYLDGAADGSYGDLSAYVGVLPHLGWVDAVLAADDAAYFGPRRSGLSLSALDTANFTWRYYTAPIPEPAAASALAAAGLLLGRRR